MFFNLLIQGKEPDNTLPKPISRNHKVEFLYKSRRYYCRLASTGRKCYHTVALSLLNYASNVREVLEKYLIEKI
ncbi:MAG: hypothetical protein A3I29_03055 [Candidatus Magasanikbacteria bacterium RIFCSPLOWO2_02_FULL_44_11]|uniref:Uncharacterized protein n=2 Tax=Candidatus Magasanikiibacteriota TaxID=1752731 RepID=A0A1F6N929_9BACT|nr:MAG: hypothetical protein A3D53_01410 [Candidatus Magasanikbacteria bacterium RIFCSPHIGHO2_02_FULL_45_10]OGH80465.1 MAG: hypothetical protein A3I29_03055 [Candidatus Magasanikbacteria bacterium RIFCSPLOWO2_02_FULL_44_11]